MIPQKTVQEILETAKIDDVIQDFISLKRRGVNMIGPFGEAPVAVKVGETLS